MQGYNSYPQQGQQQHPSMYPVQHPGQSHQPNNGQQQYGQQQQQGVYANPPQSPGAYGSQPTLPRYASSNSMAGGQQQQQGYPHSSNGGGAVSPSLSPLNPQSQRQGNYNNGNNGGYSNGLNSRYSTYGYANGGPGAQGGAHPLSNALYADSPSSPTLAGDHDDIDEKKGLASFPPSSSASSGSGSGHGVGRGANAAPAGNGGGGVAGAYKRFSAAAAPSSNDERHLKVHRIGWLDGLRFFAAWAILNATFFNATITDPNSYSAIQRSSPLYIFRSFGLGLTFFLMILGRAVSAPLWDVPATNGNGSMALNKYGSAAAPTISFPRLTRAMLTRVFRFLLPVMVVAALLWALGATNATKDCNAAGVQQPYWNLIGRFSGWITIIFNSFYAFEYQTSAAQTFTANLWTNAWFWQSSYAVYIVHMMLGNLSSARYWIYGILGFLMWTTNNYFCVALVGAVLTDMAVHGQFARVKKWPFMRVLALQIVLVGIALAFQFVNVLRNNLNKGFSVINVTEHDELQICDLIFATCFFVVFETSTILQMVLGNVVMRYLGRLAPGMYLLSPAIVYTLVPTLGVSLSNNGTSGSGVLGVTWVVTFAISVVAAAAFYFLVELPSKKAGEAFGNFVEKWGRSAEDAAAVKAPNAPAPKKISGPGGK